MQDHLDHGASKEPTNPLLARIHFASRFSDLRFYAYLRSVFDIFLNFILLLLLFFIYLFIYFFFFYHAQESLVGITNR